MTGDPAADLVDLYRRMFAIRVFEEGAESLHREGFLQGPFHSSAGQEAVAVGVCSALRPDDVITSTHRGHGHLLAKGAEMGRMLAELKGVDSGYSNGLGGSMHIADMSVGAIGENGIVGASIFLALGAALGFQIRGENRVAVAFFGDGALGQGVLYECLNMAALWRLPVVFVCEDNAYAHSYATRHLPVSSAETGWTRHFGVPGIRVDGIDVLAVRSAASAAVERAHDGEGPSYLHASCYRWAGHNLGDAHLLYRTREEVAQGRSRDPLTEARRLLEASERESSLDAVEAEVRSEFDEARRFAANGSRPTPSVLSLDLPASTG